MADPNSLYSVVAQSSATIVAILGGFLASAVLNLAVRRRGIEEEVDDAERELATARSEGEAAWREHESLRAKRLIEEWIEEDLETAERIPRADTAVKLLGAEYIRRDEFDSEWEAFRSDVAWIVRLLRRALDTHGSGNAFFLDWMRDNNVAIPEQDYWLANRLFSRELTARAPKRARIEPDSPDDVRVNRRLWDADRDRHRALIASLRDPEFEAEQRQLEREHEARWDAEIERRRARFEDAERQIIRAQGKLELLETRRRESGTLPPDLSLGFAGLAILGIFGIGVPLYFMPQLPADYRPEHKVVVILPFALGLLATLGYFSWLTLPPRRRPPSAPSLPNEIPRSGRRNDES